MQGVSFFNLAVSKKVSTKQEKGGFLMFYIKPKCAVVKVSKISILTTSMLDIGDNLTSENSDWWGVN